MRLTYISWAPHCSRSDCTARELGGTSRMIYWASLGSHPATVWLKYIGQTLETWVALARDGADVVFVMSPPPFAALAVYLYCLVRRARFVIDAHSGVFLTRRWRRFQGFHFWLCRRALTTIVTNDYLADLLAAHGARATIVADVPIEFKAAETKADFPEGFFVVFVTSFDQDEPLEAMVAAARLMPGVRCLMTGDARLGRKRLPPDLPANLALTGFLETGTYGALLKAAGVVIGLTNEKHTMQRGAYEAISQGTPVIVTDTPVLRRGFDEGAVHVDNTPEAIAGAVRAVRAEASAFKAGAQQLRGRKRAAWLHARAELETIVAEAVASPEELASRTAKRAGVHRSSPPGAQE